MVLTAQPVGGVAPYQYQWWIQEGEQWTAVGGWTTANTFSWTPTKPGSYYVGVWARSAGSTSERGEATASLPFVLK